MADPLTVSAIDRNFYALVEALRLARAEIFAGAEGIFAPVEIDEQFEAELQAGLVFPADADHSESVALSRQPAAGDQFDPRLGAWRITSAFSESGESQ